MMVSAKVQLAIRTATRNMRAWLVGGLILAAYLAIFLVLPRGVFYSPDAGGKYLQMLGYHWANGLQCQIIYPGEAMDPELDFHGSAAERAANTAMYPRRDESDEVRTGWTPWFPLLVHPFYRAWGFVGLHSIPLAAGLMLIALASLLAARLRPGTGTFAALLVAMATPVLFYSLCFWEHTLATLLVLASLLSWVKSDENRLASDIQPFRLAFSGVLMLAACALRRELIFLLGSGMLVLGFLHPRRNRYLPIFLAVLLVLGIGGGLLLLLHPNALRWIFPSMYMSDIRLLTGLISAGTWGEAAPNWIRMILLNDYEVLLPPGILGAGICGLLLGLGQVFAPVRWRRPAVLLSAALVGIPAAWLAFTGVEYRALNSLLLPTPFALLALLPSDGPRSAPRRWLGWTILLSLISFYLVLPTIGTLHGGLEWGSRYALTAIVGMNVLGAVAVHETLAMPSLSVPARWSVLMLACGLILLGAASSVRGIGELRQTRRNLLYLQTTLDQAGGPVVTDAWWLGLSLAPFAVRNEVYTLSTSHGLREWTERIGCRRPEFTYVGWPPPDEWFGKYSGHWIQRECPSLSGIPVTRYQQTPSP